MRTHCLSIHPVLRLSLAVGIGLGGVHHTLAAEPGSGATANRAEVLEAPTVEVVGAMPLPGLGVNRFQVHANVNATNQADIARSSATSLPQLLSATLPGLVVDQAQGNAHQADVAYRGFLASPRLGIPQGLSVYLDGARINEPFGDVVHWDLIPQKAIASINLIPGSNPLFGLNTLGGALAIRTKSGEHFPGSEINAEKGSFGRVGAGFEHGGSRNDSSWFLAGNHEREAGWRDHSPSRTTQLFAKLGKQSADYDIDLSLLVGNSDLIGNQLAPESFLRQRWQDSYTFPDHTRHDLASVILNGSRWLGDTRLLAANAYLRVLRLAQDNADLNEIDDKRFGIVPFEGGANDGAAGANVDSATINRVHLRQTGFGFNLNHTWLSAEDDRVTLGASLDHARSRFVQSYQLGVFNSDRSATSTGLETESVNITGLGTTVSLYVSSLARISGTLDLTASARYNYSQVRTIEHSTPQPAPALGLNNNFSYRSLNPALGLGWNITPTVNAYAGLSQGSRTPSPIELGCADRNSPCMLSNAFGSDPYLAQVMARTFETGIRGKHAGLEWHLGAYRTNLTDDIMFVSAGGGQSRGYFTNIGATRRKGIEASIGLRRNVGWSWSGHYNLVAASFQSDATLVSPNNSSRDTDPTLASDEIRVRPGNTMPGVPRHQISLSAYWDSADEQAYSGWGLGATLRLQSAVFVRGNENNRHQAGTVTGLTATRSYAGAGTAAGYALVDLNGKWRIDKRTTLSMQIGNLFDRRYSTGGILGENAFPRGSFDFNSNNWGKETFYSPGAPRHFWLGLSFKLD